MSAPVSFGAVVGASNSSGAGSSSRAGAATNSKGGRARAPSRQSRCEKAEKKPQLFFCFFKPPFAPQRADSNRHTYYPREGAGDPTAGTGGTKKGGLPSGWGEKRRGRHRGGAPKKETDEQPTTRGKLCARCCCLTSCRCLHPPRKALPEEGAGRGASSAAESGRNRSGAPCAASHRRGARAARAARKAPKPEPPDGSARTPTARN